MSRVQPALKKPDDLVALRDEIAMRTLQTLIANGRWGSENEDGQHRPYQSMKEYSEAAYLFADFMLEARNG